MKVKIAVIVLLLMAALAACGSPTATATPAITTPDSGPSSSVAAATTTPTPAQAPEQNQTQRGVGDLEGVVFTVDSPNSVAVFGVEEVLSSVPTKITAEMKINEGSATGITGMVRFDGESSTITLDVHQLESDQPFRDQFSRQRLFPNAQFAVFEIPDLLSATPAGFSSGEQVDTEVNGSLTIGDTTTPITMSVTAIDDGTMVRVLSRFTFTWQDVGVSRSQVEAASRVASVGEVIDAQIRLTLVP